jgi:ATP-binding cassette subfamily F protein uup
MALISLQGVSLGFGGAPLLEDVNLQIERGEWVGLLGRNGMGKSTLLKVIQGELLPQSGTVSRQQNTRVAYLPQEVPLGLTGKVGRILASGITAEVLDGQPLDAWQKQLQVEQVTARMGLDPKDDFEVLSAGMKRRVLLARGLANQPDLLLLDEPTNHLDIDSINWLEEFLTRWGGTLLFVTHDRVFLQHIAHRIVELDAAGCLTGIAITRLSCSAKRPCWSMSRNKTCSLTRSWPGRTWIRRGIEARRTRNEGRVRALKRLRELRAERREQSGNVKMRLQEVRRSGRLVIEVENVSFAYEGKPILRDFSAVFQRGDKVGIIGPNGSGKTTLLRLLLGELKPQRGEIEPGTNLEVAYFDQLRSQLDETRPCWIMWARGAIPSASTAEHAISLAIWKIFFFHENGCMRRSARSQAESATVCCWRACSPARPICW